MACDTLGRSMRLLIAPKQSHDILAVRRFWKVINLRPSSPTWPMTPTVCALIWPGSVQRPSSPRPRSRTPPPLIYKLRNRVERRFNKLNHFRRSATRFDRLARHYLAFVDIAATMLWMR
jgi:transposase